MSNYNWKELPRDAYIHWCRCRGVIRLSRSNTQYRYLVPRREREEKHKTPPEWRVVTPAVKAIYWCRNSGCLKLVCSTRPSRYLVPTDEVGYRAFIKRLHEMAP